MIKYLTIALLAFSINAYAQLPSGELTGNSPLYSQNDVLIANPSAQPDNTCSGQTVQLFALTGGGTNNYTYNWTSDPPGFTSQSPNPMVKPMVTTDYKVDVYDGVTTSTGHVTVIVNPLPTINLLPANDLEVREISPTEVGTCVFHSLDLDAGNPGSVYEWNDGSTSRSMHVETSGIGSDIQEYEVTVTDPSTGCSNTASITIYFTFTDCTYGVEETSNTAVLNLYPNPSSDGYFKYDLQQFKGDVNLEIFTTQGLMIKSELIPQDGMNLHTSNLDLSKQVSGVYIIKASCKEEVIFRKLIIN